MSTDTKTTAALKLVTTTSRFIQTHILWAPCVFVALKHPYVIGNQSILVY